MKMIRITFLALFFTSTLSFGCTGKSDRAQGDSSETKISKSTDSKMKNIHDFTVKTIDGDNAKLSDYQGKVMLIVNVASKCGYTKQYAPLEALYRKYADQGLVVLGFPCNDFGGQEPGSNDEIRTFCENKFDVSFPLFDKVKVLGEDRSPLFAELSVSSDPPGDIEWNFEKFVISKTGQIAGRFKSRTEPDSKEVVSLIEAELEK